jgi:hypothetical protein
MMQPLAREALLSGWRLIRRAPLAVLAWWLLRVAEQLSFEAIVSAHSGPSFQAVGMLFVVVFEAFLIAAVFRAQLSLDRPGLAWLRFGGAEAKMFAVAAATGLLGLLIAVPASIVAIYAFLYIGWPGVGLTVFSVGLAVAVLALLRFAPLPAILVDTGRIDIRAAWNATRGRYWSLASFALVLGLIERGLGAAWDQAMYLVPGRPRLTIRVTSQLLSSTSPAPPPEVVHFAWPAPYRVLEVMGHQFFGIALLIFVCAAIAAVWRASKANTQLTIPADSRA